MNKFRLDRKIILQRLNIKQHLQLQTQLLQLYILYDGTPPAAQAANNSPVFFTYHIINNCL
jgi:hypothetical protein